MVKGCGNPECEKNRKKVKFNKAEEYCPRCGKKLCYVCPDCYTVLPDESSKYCVRCEAKHKDRRDRILQGGAGVVMAVGGIAAGAVKVFGKGLKK